MANILIADDEVDLLEVLKATLEACGHTVTAARDGEAARKLIARANPPFDCVVLDVVMPRITGVKLLQLIRKNEKHHDLPVCLMTANPHERDRLLAKEGLQADILLTKPFNTMDLINSIRDLTEHGSQEDADGRRLRSTFDGRRRSMGI